MKNKTERESAKRTQPGRDQDSRASVPTSSRVLRGHWNGDGPEGPSPVPAQGLGKNEPTARIRRRPTPVLSRRRSARLAGESRGDGRKQAFTTPQTQQQQRLLPAYERLRQTMGNSCTRNSESQVVLSEHGVILQSRRTDRERERERERGRWSAPNVESVDLDTLLEAPSPPANAKAKAKAKAARRRRKKRQSLSERFHAPRRHAASAARPPRAPSFDEPNPLSRSRVHRSRTETGRRPLPTAEEDPTPIYHSYEDPGYLVGDPFELQPFDADCILGSPINSPSVIHARWGEPVDDPDEESLCTDFEPNPFKLGFCINCMKQHDVRDDGEVVAMKEYKRIARPTISKTAANALDLPSAIPIPRSSITMMPEGGRESDIDLAQLLAQRRDVLMRLGKIDQQKAKLQKRQPSAGRRTDRHTTINFGDNTRNNLRRMSSRPPGSGPIISRGSSVTLAPQPASSHNFGASKSVSMGSRLYDDEEPAQNVWL
ncbi:hypothetical protein PHYPSEUDO_004692 [Phytophthora pseudosyringae]|uniref:Uncharacterized protein n=1 Tax=Phytophthora pseudosyringae TaxID=221518 RepID=A0A8T1VMU4_9STRA|nr:hypothetical protein PHYPSEUDO_004692 [Phytophthora pseudosyringae]